MAKPSFEGTARDVLETKGWESVAVTPLHPRGKKKAKVLQFVLEPQQDTEGASAIRVEVPKRKGKSISDGRRLRVTGKQKGGVLYATRVQFLDLQASTSTSGGWVKWLGFGAVLVAIVVVLSR